MPHVEGLPDLCSLRNRGMRDLILRADSTLIDNILLAGAVRDLHFSHPGSFRTDIRTSLRGIWQGNHDLTPLRETDPDVTQVSIRIDASCCDANSRHLAHQYADALARSANAPIVTTRLHGSVTLANAERTRSGRFCELPLRYWVLVTNRKSKYWTSTLVQSVVDCFRGQLIFVHADGLSAAAHRLRNTQNISAQLSIRELVQLIYHADGVVCPLGVAPHLTAAVDTRPDQTGRRPCIVLAEPEERWHLAVYPGQQLAGNFPSLGNVRDWQRVAYEDVIRRIQFASAPTARRQPSSHKQQNSSVPVTGRSKQQLLLKFTHGLGDAVQFTVVLRHLRILRPEWDIDVVALRGKHSAFYGQCRHVFHDQDPLPSPSAYDQILDVQWHEHDRVESASPSTKPARCLREELNLDLIEQEFRYRIEVGEDADRKVCEYLTSVCCAAHEGRYPVMLLHYQGNTSGARKDLSHDIAAKICTAARAGGLIPVILDWDSRSPLPDNQEVFCPRVGASDLWGGFGSGDAEVLAALIRRASLMVGIDSGPLHVAGATNTPTLAVWTQHFPSQYFDLAENVTHFVPAEWKSFGFGVNPIAANYFLKRYRVQVYHDLAADVTAAIRSGSYCRSEDSFVRYGDLWVRRDNYDQDLVVVKDVFENDAYQTHLLSPSDMSELVVDVGAHIGCFASLWHRRNPQARIVCIEACPENIPILRANVGHFAEVIHAACTYESHPIALLNAVRPDCESTGGSMVVQRSHLNSADLQRDGYQYWHDTRDLPKVTLEDIMSKYATDRIAVLKLDCEGSEYSILGKTSSLESIGLIIGEYHDKAKWDRFRQLMLAGWEYKHISADGDRVGNFQCRRPVSKQIA